MLKGTVKSPNIPSGKNHGGLGGLWPPTIVVFCLTFLVLLTLILESEMPLPLSFLLPTAVGIVEGLRLGGPVGGSIEVIGSSRDGWEAAGKGWEMMVATWG